MPNSGPCSLHIYALVRIFQQPEMVGRLAWFLQPPRHAERIGFPSKPVDILSSPVPNIRSERAEAAGYSYRVRRSCSANAAPPIRGWIRASIGSVVAVVLAIRRE